MKKTLLALLLPLVALSSLFLFVDDAHAACEDWMSKCESGGLMCWGQKMMESTVRSGISTSGQTVCELKKQAEDCPLDANGKIPESCGPQNPQSSLPALLGVAIAKSVGSVPDMHLKDYATYLARNNYAAPQTALAAINGRVFAGKIQGPWTFVRNTVFLFMAVLLVVAGFLIMFQAQLAPQTKITIYNVLPRAAIALVLITFSFAIGALFMDLALLLTNISLELIDQLISSTIFSGSMAGGMAVSWLASTSLALVVVGLLHAGPGWAMLVLILIYLVVLIIMLLAVLVRILLCIGKMMIQTLLAPLLLGVGIIPGQEDQLKNWFKQMLVNSIAPAGMILVVGLGLTMTVAFMSLEGGLFGVLMAIIAPIIGLVIMWGAFKVPASLEQAFGVGAKKK